MNPSDAFREGVHREYLRFFERAEATRRWNVFSDVPWERLDPRCHDTDGALVAETFLGVEMYLPDYVSAGVGLVRETFGQAWFQAAWGYEESKHGLALRQYLVRSGQRTPDDLAAFERAILARRWTLPFATPRLMTCYGLLQELSTFVLYRRQLRRARERGDAVLAAIYGFIARDEAAHADFYRRVVALNLAEDRLGTLADLAHVFRNFRMPAEDLVPDYADRVARLRAGAQVDRGVWLREVWFRALGRLRVDRAELARAPQPARAGEPPP